MRRLARLALAVASALSLGIVVVPAGIQGSGTPVAGIGGSDVVVLAGVSGGGLNHADGVNGGGA